MFQYEQVLNEDRLKIEMEFCKHAKIDKFINAEKAFLYSIDDHVYILISFIREFLSILSWKLNSFVA